MTRLILILHSIIGATLASVGVVVLLVSGVTGLWPLLGGAFAGWLVGWPVAYIIAKRMQ
ncbi:MAG: CTP synthetase [Rhodobacterales bacterium]|nr:MAG: CTP synthetase [Rhodobacterales bacterium]